MIKALVISVLFAATAHADPIGGVPAIKLTQALHYAGMKPLATTPKLTFRVASISCAWMLDKEPVLGEHVCKVDKVPIKGAAAFLLYLALVDAGIRFTPTDSSSLELVTNLSCVVDPAKRMELGTRCDWDGSKAQPVLLAPKKTR